MCALGLALGVFDGFQRSAADALFPSSESDPRVVVVGIDRATIRDAGVPWPWPRDRQGELIAALHDAGAEVVAVDLSYPTVSDADADAALAAAVDSGPTVLAVPAGLDGSSSGGVVAIIDVALPAPEIAGRAAALGHVVTYAHPVDGVVRTLPLIVEDQDRNLVPSLALQTLMVAEGTELPTLRPDGVQVGSRFVPTEADHTFRLNFASEVAVDEAAFVSAREVLSGTVDEELLDGAYVVLGVTDPTLGDSVPTPVAKADGAPGVLVHAQALNTMLTSSYLTPVSDARTLAWVFVLALLVAVAVASLPVSAAIAVTVAVGAANLVVAFWKFERGDIVDLVYLNLAILLAFVGALGVKYFTETRHRRRVARLFARYIPEPVALELAEEGRLDRASGGERVEVTVSFCDLRGFTAMSEALPAGTVRDVLERYYERMVSAVVAHDGTVMQFVGDEVFALWGAPLPQPDHRQRALAAALDAQAVWGELTAELAEMGADPVYYGIGLNSGEVVAGHVGGGDRLQYTVIGDTVNVGARLCSLAGRGEIVCSDTIYRAGDPPPSAEPVGNVTLKGISRELTLWRIPAPPAMTAPAKTVETDAPG